MKKGIEANKLAKEFNLTILGNTDSPILTTGSLRQSNRNTISWAGNAENLSLIEAGYIIIYYEISPTYNTKPEITYLITEENPKIVYAKILNKYFQNEEDIFQNCVEDHRKNKNIRIADYVFIGKNVEIGDGTSIHPNVVIHSRTRIGKNCIIKSHVSLGTEGLGHSIDPETGDFIQFPQIGSVILEDDIEIGPCSTVRRSALDETLIKKGSKIGSMVNIGHNCIIGRNCILSCQIVTSGSSEIGDNVFMGVGSIVKENVNIGPNVTIGQGAVVVKNVPAGSTYVGNPAEDIKEYKLWSKVKRKLLKTFGDNVSENN